MTDTYDTTAIEDVWNAQSAMGDCNAENAAHDEELILEEMRLCGYGDDQRNSMVRFECGCIEHADSCDYNEDTAAFSCPTHGTLYHT